MWQKLAGRVSHGWPYALYSEYDGEEENDVFRLTFLKDPSGCCTETAGLEKQQGEQ